MAEAPERILEISRDPLFKAVYPERTTWLRTGRPLEPYGRHAGHASYSQVGLPTVLAGLIRRTYDFAVFPAVRVSVPGDAHNRGKARVRRLLLGLSRSRLVTRATAAVFGLGSMRHIIRDVGDFPDLDEVGTAWLSDAVLYSKREVLESDLEDSPLGIPVVYTPMPFELEPYEGLDRVEKTTDVFYAARPVGDLRQQAHDVLDELERDGVLVDRPEKRLDFTEYLLRMAKARLVLSPRGQGEHCYRHYESLLAGSVPVINRPLRPVHYDLRHGESCLFYEPTPDGLASMLRQGLEDPGLRNIAESGAAIVRSRHDKAAICAMLLGEAGFEGTTT